MMDRNWSLLAKIPDLITRDVLVVRLGEKGIEVYAPERDMIVNVSPSPNFSLEGYSALFDGYPVYVDQGDLARSRQVFEDFQKEIYQPSLEPVDHTSKFYFACVMTMILPGILHAIALFHLVQALRKKQSFKPAKAIFSALIFVASSFFPIILIQNTLL